MQEELSLNLYDYGARNYDPAIGRWFNIDPLAEKFINTTPYNYVLNNPVNMIDPDGMEAQDIWGRNRYNEMGMYIPPHERGSKDGNDNGYERDGNGGYKKVNNLGGDDKDYLFENGKLVDSKDVTESAHERTLRTYGIKGPSSLNLIETDVIGPAIALRGLAIGSFKLLNGGWSLLKSAVFAKNLVKIAQIEDDVMIFTAKIGNETVEGVTNFIVKENQLHLNQLHLQGSSGGQIGRQNLWKMAKDLGKQFKVEEVIIQGGKRTTGKYKGQIPSPIKIPVN
ncbi:RHS repeat domain-containing protein [Empedobacter sp. GD03644]|uniref:RHS repeat domain-containing protein n=1 Tax=unclassified Empedobacter TaxID=2643773 RepID=UPI0038B2C3EC